MNAEQKARLPLCLKKHVACAPRAPVLSETNGTDFNTLSCRDTVDEISAYGCCTLALPAFTINTASCTLSFFLFDVFFVKIKMIFRTLPRDEPGTEICTASFRSLFPPFALLFRLYEIFGQAVG